jgi:hypothetical protein
VAQHWLSGSAIARGAFVKAPRIFGAFVILTLSIGGCQDSGSSPTISTGVQGQVYSIATPGPTPVNWVPPPFEQVSTVIVLDADHRSILELLTDNKGRFSCELRPGTYFLRVKESMIAAETGPYVVKSGEVLSVRAHFDSGMR